MTRIRLYDHPFAVVAPQVFEVDSLALWLLGRYGEAPAVKIQIFAGEPSADTEISHDATAILLSDADEYVILQSPGGILEGSLLVIMAILAVAVIILMPKPVMPGNVNRTQQSPNNALSNRENQVRMLERIEDIYGTVKSIPSLMMPTYVKYIDHSKYEYGYYCIGRGYYDLAELRDGDTLISDIDGAAASVYKPFTSPNSGDAPVLQVGDAIIDDVLTVSRAIEIDGITLKALNQVQLGTAYTQYSYAPVAGGNGLITQVTKRPNFNAVCVVGDWVTVVMPDYVVMTSPGTPADPETGSPGTPPTYVTYNYTGTYVVAVVGDGNVTVNGVSWPVYIPANNVTTDPSGPGGGGA
jgi:hypothetical protein